MKYYKKPDGYILCFKEDGSQDQFIEDGYVLATQEEVNNTLPPAPTYQQLRAAAYPSFGEQLGALWKGGEAQAAMAAEIQAVKDKYPKA